MPRIPRRLLLLLVPALLALAQDVAQTPIVRSIRYEHFKKVRVQQILERFNERELRLAVEQPYHPEDLEAAKKVLADLLAEHGIRKARIQVEVRPLEPEGRAVEVVFSQL
jgi:outer membrane protein assembly factor BamA